MRCTGTLGYVLTCLLLAGSPATGSGAKSAPAGPVPAEDSADETTGSVVGTFKSLARLQTRGATSQKDVVLYLTSEVKKEHDPPAAPVEVTQSKLQFVPHVLPVLAGTTISFKNADGVTHNVFCSEVCCPVDKDMPASSSATHVFDKPGLASIVCRLHPDMSLWVIVLDNPWFTRIELEKSEDGGEKSYSAPYRISGVPPGEYTLTFWNKKLQPQAFPVTVEAGKETTVDVQIAED